MKKTIILVSIVGLMLVVSLSNPSVKIAFGQTATDMAALNAQAVQQAETVTTADLGVTNPGLLPTNPFYFFKELSRNVQRFFTFNPVAKAQLELKIANEKAAEAKKIQEIVPNDNKAITMGVENYQAAQERVNSSLESLKTASSTPEFEKLMNSVATNIVLHQKVLDEIGIKASDSADVKSAVDSAKVKIDESAVTAIQDNPTDFANKLQNALMESKGSELKHVRSVEIITNIEARAPEAAKPALLKVQENLTNKLNESVQQATESSGSAAVQKLIKEIPSSDSVQRAVTIKQLQQKALVPTVKTSVSVFGTVSGSSTVSVGSVCDSLKQTIEQLTANLKAGDLTEEQYKIKYEMAKKELEKCSSGGQVICTMDAKLCSDGSYVSRTGPNCEFAKCPGESGGSVSKYFSNVYWQCYDGKEYKDSFSCKTSEMWQAEAKKFCDGHCYADNSKCGVNSFSISNECDSAAQSPNNQAITPAVVIKEDCGKENEKLNRDPLIGPVNKPCCYGLKENRADISYSICVKPEEGGEGIPVYSEIATSTSSGIANPAAVYCIDQGFKEKIMSNQDGGQYGICIFNDGSNCDEWAYYRGECKPGVSSSNSTDNIIAPNTATTSLMIPTTNVSGGSATPSVSSVINVR